MKKNNKIKKSVSMLAFLFVAQWKSTGDVFFVSWYFVSLHYEHT